MNAHCLEFDSDGRRQPCIDNNEFGKQHVMVRASHWDPDLAWAWGLDHGPSKLAADAAETGSWDYQVDM
jgi:hypothetical protein